MVGDGKQINRCKDHFHYTLKPHMVPMGFSFLSFFGVFLSLPLAPRSLRLHLAVCSSSSSWSGICEMSIRVSPCFIFIRYMRSHRVIRSELEIMLSL